MYAGEVNIRVKRPDGQYDYKEVPNFVFEDELEVDGYFKGRSAVNVYLKSKSGERYTTGLAHFISMCKYMVNGKVRGKFTWYKQGSAVLLRRLDDEN